VGGALNRSEKKNFSPALTQERKDEGKNRRSKWRELPGGSSEEANNLLSISFARGGETVAPVGEKKCRDAQGKVPGRAERTGGGGSKGKTSCRPLKRAENNI